MYLNANKLKKKPLILMMNLALGAFLTLSTAQAAEYTYNGDESQLQRLENKNEAYSDEFNDGALGFGSGQGGNLSNNTVNIDYATGEAPQIVYGAMDSANTNLNLSNNTVNLINGNVLTKDNDPNNGGASVYGALAYTQGNGNITANNNTVNLGEDFGYVPYIMGAHVVAMGDGNITANNNVINVSGYITKDYLDLVGVEAYSAGKGNITANNNIINVTNTTVDDGLYVEAADLAAFGTGTINASGNAINIKNVTTNYGSFTAVEGGNNYTWDGEAEEIKQNTNSTENQFTNNQINIDSTTINTGWIDAVYSAVSGTIDNNHTIINNSELENVTASAVHLDVYHDDISGVIFDNSLTISNSKLFKNNGEHSYDQSIFSAVQVTQGMTYGVATFNISNNKLIIGENVTVDDDTILAAVYLDDVKTENMTFDNNTVSIDSRSDLSNVTVYGVYEAEQTRTTSSNDYNSTLEIHSYNQTAHVNSANNFSTYNFFIEGDKVIDEALLTTNETVDLVNNDKTVDIGIQINGKASLEKGDDFTLFDNVNAEGSDYATEEGKNITVKKGVGGYYEATLKYNEDGTLQTDVTSDLKQNSTSKALVEPQSAMMAFLNQGADLIAEQNIAQGENAWKAFGAISGGTSRYNTGSHIRINGTSFLVGSAMHKDQFALGAFLEMGFANYHSHNNETSGEIYGSGKTNYKGVGLLARYDLENEIYIDGNLRVGRAKVDYETGDLQVDGINAAYDTSATYFGASIGAGKVFNLDERSSIDVSARYSYTHLPGKSITTSVDSYDFNNTNSHRAQADAVYSFTVNDWFAPYLGVGYQYEFAGNSSAKISGVESEKTRLQGNTGSLLVGLRSNKINNFYYDIGLKGYVGKREGVVGSISLNYDF